MQMKHEQALLESKVCGVVSQKLEHPNLYVG